MLKALDNTRLLSRALRAIRCASVRFRILPALPRFTRAILALALRASFAVRARSCARRRMTGKTKSVASRYLLLVIPACSQRESSAFFPNALMTSRA